MKIRHGAIVDNVVTYVYAKFGDDQLWNEKALADRKSDNNNNTKNNVRGARGPVLWPYNVAHNQGNTVEWQKLDTTLVPL